MTTQNFQINRPGPYKKGCNQASMEFKYCFAHHGYQSELRCDVESSEKGYVRDFETKIKNEFL